MEEATWSCLDVNLVWFTSDEAAYKIRSVKNMTIREKLIVLRDKAGISQMALADQLGVSRQAVSRWESGDTTPSMDKLKALAKIYGVSLDWLCSDDADTGNAELHTAAESIEDEKSSCAVVTNIEEKRPRKIMKSIAAVLVIGIVIFVCVWLAMGKKEDDTETRKFEDMYCDIVDIPDPNEDGFDFEWKD